MCVTPEAEWLLCNHSPLANNAEHKQERHIRSTVSRLAATPMLRYS